MRLILIAAAFLGCAAPDATFAAPSPAPAAERVNAEMAAYGAWLERTNAIQAPVTAAIRGMQGRWQAAFAGRDIEAAIAAYRPVLAEINAAADRANADYAAMPTPEFTALDLPPDTQPRALISEMVRLNGQVKDFVRSYEPMFEALRRNDLAAVQRAGRQMIRGLNLILESQIVMTRAGLGATSRDDPSWEMQNVQLLYFRAAARVLASWPENLVSATDRSLPGDLRTLAGLLEGSVASGTERLERELATMRPQLADAQRRNDAARAAVLRRAVAVYDVDREIFTAGRELAGLLRTHAERMNDGRVDLNRITDAFRDMQGIRRRFDDIIVREAAALSGTG